MEGSNACSATERHALGLQNQELCQRTTLTTHQREPFTEPGASSEQQHLAHEGPSPKQRATSGLMLAIC